MGRGGLFCQNKVWGVAWGEAINRLVASKFCQTSAFPHSLPRDVHDVFICHFTFRPELRDTMRCESLKLDRAPLSLTLAENDVPTNNRIRGIAFRTRFVLTYIKFWHRDSFMDWFPKCSLFVLLCTSLYCTPNSAAIPLNLPYLVNS